MTTESRRGFTLVELLVVIAIIGVLVGLLVPAVNAAREMARKAECSNNMRNLAQALRSHETDKQYFPGRINVVLSNGGQQIPVSWMTKLLPYIENQILWDKVVEQGVTLNDWNNVTAGIANPTAVPAGTWYVSSLELASCPSDPVVSQIAARLSYVINAGIWDRDLGSNMNQWQVTDGSIPGERRANGVAHYLPYNSTAGRVDAAYIGKNDGTSATLLLSENVNAISWPLLEEGTTTMVWTAQDAWLPESANLTQGRQYAINRARDRYLDDQLLQTSMSNPEQLVSIARPSSNHSKGVNVAFCDGRVEFMADDIHPWIYARRLSTSRGNAREPNLGPTSQVPAQMLPQDATGTAVSNDF